MPETKSKGKTYRASFIPTLMKCARAGDGELRIQSWHPLADLGTAVHEAAESYITGTDFSVRALARAHNLPDDLHEDLAVLVAFMRQAWDELAGFFPNPHIESALEADFHGYRLSGHPDVLSVIGSAEGNELRVLDWKTGYVRKDFIPQLLTYGILGMVGLHGIEKVTVTVVWLRDREYQTFRFDMEAIRRFEARLLRTLSSEGGDYTVGSHCEHCPRFHDCPARAALVQRTLTDLETWTTQPPASIRELQPLELHDLRAGAKILGNTIDAFDGMVRSEIRVGGPLPLPDGMALALKEVERRQLVPKIALPIMAERLSEEEITDECVRLSISAAEGLVSKKAIEAAKAVGGRVRGAGKEAKERFVAELDAAGAINRVKSERLTEIEMEVNADGNGTDSEQCA